MADPTQRELDLWAAEWARPQAVEWERQGMELQVAFFVRQVVDAESHRSTVASRQEVRRMMDSLGITDAGRRTNRWLIAESEDAQAVERPRRQSAKSKLKVVRDESA